MEIEGTIERVIDRQSGQGSKGLWIKTQYLLKTDGQYPKDVCLTVWGDDIQFNVGIKVKASIDISSREYNGKFYTDIKVWKAEVLSGAYPDISPKHEDLPGQFTREDLPGDEGDDLPF